MLNNERTTTLLMVSKEDLREILLDIIAEYFAQPTETAKEDSLLSAKEVEKLLGVAHSTLWRWEKNNYLNPVRVGTKLFYKKSDVEQIKQIAI